MLNKNSETHTIDAKGKILGKVATEAAIYLIGKNSAAYVPHQNTGTKVTITNAKDIAVTGRKLTDKIYFRYTGYSGGIKKESLKQKLARKPTEVLKIAIEGMLPKNKLQRERMANLKIYESENANA